MTTLPDQQLILLAQQGNTEAAGVLYQRHLRFLLSQSRTYAGRDVEPEDLVQEAWVRILCDLDRFTPRKSFRSWAVTVLRNLGRDTASRRSRRRELLDQHQDDVIVPSADFRQERREEDRRKTLYRLIEDLTPRQRLALLLHVGERCPSAEVSRSMGCKPPTVRTTCFFALERIRRQLPAASRRRRAV